MDVSIQMLNNQGVESWRMYTAKIVLYLLLKIKVLMTIEDIEFSIQTLSYHSIHQ